MGILTERIFQSYYTQQGTDTSIDLKYYDINKNGIVNDDDVNIVMDFFLILRQKKIIILLMLINKKQSDCRLSVNL